MSEFVESEAEESEDEEVIQKKRKNRFDDDEEEEEEEDDEEKLREEMKDLINDEEEEEVEDEGEDSDDSASRKKRKRHEDFDDNLEDDDYELIEENLGVKVERQKKFRRLKRIEDDDSEDEAGPADEKGDIEMRLFDDEAQGEGEPVEKEAMDVDDQYQDISGSEMESDPDDFIVDDNGQPISKGKKKRHIKFNDSALQEAQDIFGVDFDYQEFENLGDDYEDAEEYDDEELEEEVLESRSRVKKTRKKPTRKSIFDVFEPSELIRGHLTDEDNRIKATDIPERFQIRSVPVTSADDEEIDEESHWIYKHAFNDPTLSLQSVLTPNIDPTTGPVAPEFVRKPIGGHKEGTAVGKIKEALKFMRNQNLEVPFIAFYRKEYVEPDLNINDLWTVFKWDEKWCQLKQRKDNLIRLYKKMQDYQCEVIMKEPDLPIPESMRVIGDSDFDRLRKIQSPEELCDAYLQFKLYYSKDMPAMKDAAANQAIIDRRRRKAARAAALLTKKLDAEEKAALESLKEPNPEVVPEDGAEKDPNSEEEKGEKDVLEQEKEKEPEKALEKEPEKEPEEEEEEDEGDEELTKVKLAVHRDIYMVCSENGLDGLVKKFGLSPEYFGENLRDNYQRHEVEQYPVSPNEVASDYVTKRFSTPEEVLKGATLMVAMQISRDMAVRKCVRQVFFERAKLTCYPTKKGIKEVDETHPCYSNKYLKNKPVRDLQGEQFLRLHQAEKDGLITMHISIDKFGEQNGYASEIKPLYERDEFSSNVLEWNKLRNQAVDMALTRFLYPAFEKELRLKLIAESKEGILKACCRKLYNWLKVAPYCVDQQIEEDEDYDTRDGVRVMGLAFTPDRNIPAFCAMIDGVGEVTDFLRLPHILYRRNAWKEEERQLKEKDIQSLKRFILAKKPHVICVGGESREAVQIIEDLKLVVTDLAESDQLPVINVELLENDLATVYMNSKKAENDFRDYPELLRQAISLARRLQDPLVEFSQLCSHDEEIMCLKFHPLMDQLPKEDLLQALYLEFVNRTNEVGVDVNYTISQAHTGNLLQFVCGLGPRKATQLTKVLKQNHQRLESRTQLVTLCKMGPQVFINCAGFIRIDTASLGDSDAYVEVLDGSRVHPEAYEWARKMAVDALEYDDMAEDVNPAGALEEILENPEKLKDLDLDAFAEELERQGFGNKSITLYDIRAELNHRYKDLRTQFRPPTPEETFNMLTKETPQTFFIGKMVLARVSGIARRKPQGEQLDQANPNRNDDSGMWQCPFCLKNDFPELSEVWNHFDAGSCPGQAMGVRTFLDNGVSGFIPTKNISDKRVTNPEERVRQGMTINCRITKINIERFSVDLTCKSSDLADKKNEWRPQKDVYYDYDAEEKDKKIEDDQKKRANRPAYVKRVIVHPSFHNISFKEAEAALAKMDQGDLIIRPSSKGVDHLTVTWKVFDGINQHIDVREEGKEKAFSLGQSLWIGNEEFEDLDEIIARHVQPMAAYARELTQFRYFREANGGSREAMDKIAMEEKKKAPSKIPYFVSASREYPGKFLLSYLPRVKTRHEYITVSPEGFRYRQRNFHSTNSLFKWFKEHFRDPIPGTPSSTIARTPAGRSSVYIGATPSINLANVDPQAIQRAAQSMPSHLFNTLSQVAGQTPGFPSNASNYGGNATPAGNFPYQPYTPSQPMNTPLMTPSYHPMNTPAQSVVATPRYNQTPQTNWAHPNQTPRQIPTTPRQIPITPRHMTPRPQATPRHITRLVTTPGSVKSLSGKAPTADDWALMAKQWAKEKAGETPNEKKSNSGKTATPRSFPSPMVESTPAGDATPLIDEH